MGSESITFGSSAILIKDIVQPSDVGDFPYIGLEHIEESELRLSSYGNAKDVQSAKFRFNKGDILFGKLRPYFRKVIKAPFDGICSTDIWVVRAKNGIDQGYLYYWMASDSFIEYATRGSEGTRMPRAKWEHVSRYTQTRLSLPEQRAIAHILGSLDDKIELNRQMNRTLEAMAQAVFKSWFVDFDPVHAKAEGRDTGLPAEIADLFPDSFMDSELGEIPKGWRIQAISDLADIVGGSTPRTTELNYWQDGVHSWATPKDLSTLSVPLLLETERRITDAGLAQISSGLLPVGTVLLSSRAPIGYLAIAEIPVAINQGFIAMKPKKDISNLFVLFWTAFAHDDILSRANGSTFLEISKTNFRPISLVAPPSMIIRAFDQRVREMYNRIVDNERESRTLVALRDTLLPKLISGELRVLGVGNYLKEVV
ncbi:MAG TPA: restriction endonuclease subunit S [Candidatus Marinimicrobia bacterium]|nr:restriction endonuclease subunit S [Candidatus Neomarinimicrobiota bacterium]